MSEEKIIQHAQKAVHIVESREKTWRRKIGELIEEIIIIVFAVTITLAFHNWNDWRNERKMEKEFLTGTSADLKAEATDLDEAIKDLTVTANYYDTVWQQVAEKRIDAAYIDSNSYELVNTVYFTFDNGRFEGFKSSGYLRLIENQVLLKHLTSFFTNAIPFQVVADNDVYQERRRDYNTYIGTKAPMDAQKVVHVSQMLHDPAVLHHIVFYGEYMRERIRAKKSLAAQMRRIAAEIDKELAK
jgi:hypothetical protein